MPPRSKRQAQSQAASQNAKHAHENATKHAGHADRADPDCYECLFPRSLHFSLRDVGDPERFGGEYAAYVGICESTAGSITAYGAQLHLEHPDWQIATVIETHAAWPCGACRGMKGELNRHEVHEHHYSPEEDVVSNWLLTTCHSWAVREAQFARISNSWGFRSLDYKATDTIQGVDYRIGSEKDTREWRPCKVDYEYTMSFEDGAQLHADAWCIPDARLSAKCVTEPGAALCTGRFDKTRTYPTALVFCAGPYVDGTSSNKTRDWDWAETRICKEKYERLRNCQPYSIECGAAFDELWALPDPHFLLRRTHSERAENSPSFLEAGVAWAVYTALRASAACGCNVVLLPFVGRRGGRSWQTEGWATRLRRFEANVRRMVNDGRLPDGSAVAPLAPLTVFIVVSPREKAETERLRERERERENAAYYQYMSNLVNDDDDDDSPSEGESAYYQYLSNLVNDDDDEQVIDGDARPHKARRNLAADIAHCADMHSYQERATF